MTTRYDIAIIGGGIVGMATAMALTQRSRASLIVLEAEDRFAAHQTGNNSGVIHSGIYYKPGSLKARNCIQGREALYRFCEQYDIPHERCGKIIVATLPDELPRLEALYQRGLENGLTEIRKLGPEEIKEYEPHSTGLAAIYVPYTGIVDYTQVTQKYAELAQAQGATLQTRARLIGVKQTGNVIILETTAGTYETRHLINCAGLHSDRVARMCGLKPELQIIPFRGEYYDIVPERRYLVKNLIYPVPDPRFPFLGVHFTRRVNGSVEAGPNAVLAFKREGYRMTDVSLRDVADYLFFPGFWRMGLKYWKTGFGEFYRSLSKRAFVRALQRLLPELQETDVERGGAGVRAQALNRNGALLDDFAILETPNMIHVLNAPSPAATASISIGQTIAETALRTFDIPAREVS
ncbi:L-2-hydroxyglutarate oxidase [Thermanaerothrix sp. 4228-RoL]|uniref:L-2-hydroxyglutarate oxidase n=1 Tax=Thermanaerothrix solaris TaxID=3058434 RepID=A0ABU3NJU3_9CHLR|nr:L-2-hydroxyglutarate oxidase [Thermanaerothrix sp. 4228-RoL]MDT8897099.1 L-2-hydroxyglutarate oxidase [Thermanaerothrix sp. 4228-RoL]